jgi:hypothetical protein
MRVAGFRVEAPQRRFGRGRVILDGREHPGEREAVAGEGRIDERIRGF